MDNSGTLATQYAGPLQPKHNSSTTYHNIEISKDEQNGSHQ